MTRPQALEAVAEAARDLQSELTHFGEASLANRAALDDALATLDALPTTTAAAAPPTDAIDDYDLALIAVDVEQRWFAELGIPSNPNEGQALELRKCRALWTDGHTRGTQDGRASMLAEVRILAKALLGVVSLEPVTGDELIAAVKVARGAATKELEGR